MIPFTWSQQLGGYIIHTLRNLQRDISTGKDYALATPTVAAVGTAIGAAGDFSTFSVIASFGGLEDSGDLETWLVFIFFFFFMRPVN